MGLPIEKLPDWPAALNKLEALAYTGVSETQLKEWQRAGVVRFRHRGPRGEAICPRTDLDAALARMFDGANDDGPVRF